MSERGTSAAVEKTMDRHRLAGKYLTFRLGNERFGFEAPKVREIVGLMGITVVPRTPPSIRGVINLRGEFIPVVDLRLKLGMASEKDTLLTCIVVVDMDLGDQLVQMGVLVDEVTEVRKIAASSIEPAPIFGADVNTDFILAMTRIEDEVTILLHVDELLSAAELIFTARDVASVGSMTESAAA